MAYAFGQERCDGAAKRFANRPQRVSRYAGGVAFDSAADLALCVQRLQ